MTIIPFVDHTIGYKCLELLLVKERQSEYKIPFIITTKVNSTSWWPKVSALADKFNKQLIEFESLDQEILIDEEPDYFFLISWKYILAQEICKIPGSGIINLHYSLLPKYRGVYPVNWSLIEGSKETGVTFHFIGKGIDEGRVIYQENTRIDIDDTALSLINKLDVIAINTFSKLLDNFPIDITSSSILAHNTDYYSHEKFENIKKIDLDKKGTFRDFYNLIRGMSFHEERKLAYIEEDGKKIYLFIKTETK